MKQEEGKGRAMPHFRPTQERTASKNRKLIGKTSVSRVTSGSRVSRFLTTHQHNQAIQYHLHWMFSKIHENTQIKNTQIKYNS